MPSKKAPFTVKKIVKTKLEAKAKPAAKSIAKPAKKTATKPATKPVAKSKAKPAAKPVVKPIAKPKAKPAAKPIAKANAKPIAKAKPVAKKPEVKAPVKSTAKKPEVKAPAKTPAKTSPSKKVPVKKNLEKATKRVAKPEKLVAAKPEKPAAKPKTESAAKPKIESAAKPKIESLLIVPGVKFLKIPFFFDAEKEEKSNKRKHIVLPKYPEKPTVSSRPKIGNIQDTKSLVELLSQQLEYENKMYFEGCEGQICVKCNINNVDAKFYVDKSLGYCTECAARLGLGQSKEGVFSDDQMELMRRSMEKSMEKAGNLDEDDIDIALDDMDSLELEEALLAVEEAEFNNA